MIVQQPKIMTNESRREELAAWDCICSMISYEQRENEVLLIQLRANSKGSSIIFPDLHATIYKVDNTSVPIKV